MNSVSSKNIKAIPMSNNNSGFLSPDESINLLTNVRDHQLVTARDIKKKMHKQTQHQLSKVLSNDKSIEDFGMMQNQEVYIAANDTFSEDEDDLRGSRKKLQSKSTLEPCEVKPSLA